jgi:hypothetical protein
MKSSRKIEDFTREEYDIFRAIMIEEAWSILSNKRNYLKDNSLSTTLKILHLDEMTDFFYIEDELEVCSEFNSLKKTVVIRHFLKDHILDI